MIVTQCSLILRLSHLRKRIYNITFDSAISTGSKVILRALAEEGEPGNEGNTMYHVPYVSLISDQINSHITHL